MVAPVFLRLTPYRYLSGIAPQSYNVGAPFSKFTGNCFSVLFCTPLPQPAYRCKSTLLCGQCTETYYIIMHTYLLYIYSHHIYICSHACHTAPSLRLFALVRTGLTHYAAFRSQPPRNEKPDGQVSISGDLSLHKEIHPFYPPKRTITIQEPDISTPEG
jgi:hypothetical protein